MTQIQRILSRLEEVEDHRTFAELYDHLEDVPKGSLSALLANLYKDGLVDRRERKVENGRDLNEYQITAEGKSYLQDSIEEGEKKETKTKAKKPRQSRTRKHNTMVRVEEEGSTTADFSEVEKFAQKRSEYSQLHNFMAFLQEEDVVKKNVGELDNYVLQYVGVDPETFNKQRKALDDLMSTVE